jgi:hypothetical protein
LLLTVYEGSQITALNMYASTRARSRSGVMKGPKFSTPLSAAHFESSHKHQARGGRISLAFLEPGDKQDRLTLDLRNERKEQRVLRSRNRIVRSCANVHGCDAYLKAEVVEPSLCWRQHRLDKPLRRSYLTSQRTTIYQDVVDCVFLASCISYAYASYSKTYRNRVQ